MDMCIRHMDPSQRPRERLLEHGARVLTDAELLAVLLRTGHRGVGAVGLATELLAGCGGLAGLARLEPAALARRKGVGPAKAAGLTAAVELARRLAAAELRAARRLDRPEVAGSFLVAHLRDRPREVFGFLTLDGRHGLIRLHELSAGTRRTAPVDAAELFRLALLDGASGLLLFHNHPTGILDPSADDLELTRRLVQGGGVVGVDVLDHLIVAGGRWLSLRASHPAVFSP